MIKELKNEAVSVDEGKVVTVSSRYSVPEDCELVKVLGADFVWDNDELVVTTSGERSCAFDIVVECDDVEIFTFVHTREVRRDPGVKSINRVAPSVRPKLSEIRVVTPSLEELHSAPRELPREGF